MAVWWKEDGPKTDNPRIQYEYDGHQNLAGVTDRSGATTQFVYFDDPDHYLDQILDPLGRTAASLPATLRPAFWAPPKRAPVADPPLVAAAPTLHREQKLELLLEINKRLNSSLTSSAVLERALAAPVTPQ